MSNDKIVWDKLIDAGLTPAGAAGMMGNLYAESGLEPTNLQNTYEKKLGFTDAGYTVAVDNGCYTNFASDGAGYGLAQWTHPSRKANLHLFAKNAGMSIGDLDMQVGFLLQELQVLFRGVWDKLRTTSSVREASDCVLLQFERPADQSAANCARRAGYAQEFYEKLTRRETIMTPQERLIATAQAQDGYMGKKSNAQLDDFTANTPGLYNKFARDLDALMDFYNGKKQGFDWCDVFVDWCYVTTFGRDIAQKLLCQPDKSCGAGTGYSLNYYKAKGRFFTSPQPADQIFFGTATTTTHTGIVTAVSGGYVYTEEGNAGNPSAVRSCKYPLSYSTIKGYGRPDWSLAPADKPEPDIEKEDNEMPTYKTLNDVPEGFRPTIQKLMEQGALMGEADPDPTLLDDNVLNVSYDYCRVMTTLDRMGKLG